MMMFFPFREHRVLSGSCFGNEGFSVNRLPSIVPGGKYKKQAPECRRLVKDILETPFEYVKKQMASTSKGFGLFREN